MSAAVASTQVMSANGLTLVILVVVLHLTRQRVYLLSILEQENKHSNSRKVELKHVCDFSFRKSQPVTHFCCVTGLTGLKLTALESFEQLF